MRVGIFGVAHTFRAGSRIRISLEAPGGDRTRWAFDTFDTNGMVANDVEPLARLRLAGRVAGRAPRDGTRGSAAVSGSPRSAVPELRSGRQRRLIFSSLSS